MKHLALISLSLFLLCSCGRDEGSRSGPNPSSLSTLQGGTSGGGGVGVGNMASTISIPETAAVLTVPNSWSSSTANGVLIANNENGSTIEAAKALITNLVSPNQKSLQHHLSLEYPGRPYKDVLINGLEGLRSDFVNTENEKESDLYLLSEAKDLIHIQSHLKKRKNGIVEGDYIISTVMVKYLGEPVTNSSPKAITLNQYTHHGSTKLDVTAAYSFLDDCRSYIDDDCRGASILYGNGENHEVSVGNAGYAHGRIVDLGAEKDVPFEAIQIQGEYLVAPVSKIPLSDIYTAFTTQDQKVEQDRLELKEGHVYLVRTMNWPKEDLITKMRVDKIGDPSVTLTYQKLAAVKEADLQKQVDAMNQFTLQHEQPLSEGEVTLYNRILYNNYFYSAFNFEYSTSGNMFITNNSWDFGLEDKSFESYRTAGAIGEVTDLGTKALSSVSVSDLPDFNKKDRVNPNVTKGHTYIVYDMKYDSGPKALSIGAFHVIDVGANYAWVRLKFKRLSLSPAMHFQKWINLGIPQNPLTVTLEGKRYSPTATFYPFIGMRGDQQTHYYEDISLSPDSQGNVLHVDSRPYGSGRGFFKLGQNIALDSVTEQNVESFKGHFDAYPKIQKGEVYAVYLENFYDKIVMVMRVEDSVPGKSATLTFKYLSRAKTPFSEDSDAALP